MNKNVVSVILAVGLVIIPSMFVWYNVLACWDVFGNTGNLKVAVANTDAGYKSELLPMDVNVGDEVVNALRANDQLSWVFTDEEDAIDGAASGRYYAALVIPESFSEEMMNFYSSDSERAPIIYYSNEKKSAIAPKVTDQGADQISYQVNKVFAETISEVGLNLIDTAIGLVDDDETAQNLSTLTDRIDNCATQMTQHSNTLESYLDIIDAVQSLLKSSQDLLDETKNSVDDVATSVDGTTDSVMTLTNALETTADSLTDAISVSISNYEQTASAIDDAFTDTGKTADDTKNALNNSADNITKNAEQFQKVIDSLTKLSSSLPTTQQEVVKQFAEVLKTSVDRQKANADSIKDVANTVGTTKENLDAKHQEVKKQTDEAINSLKEVESTYSDDLKSKLNEVAVNVAVVSSKLSDNYSDLSNVQQELSDAMDGADSKLRNAKSSVNVAIGKLSAASTKLSEIAQKLRDAMDSGNLEAVKDILGDDPSLLASSLSAPIGIERHAEFPVCSFGAAMSPLYASLGLFVGSLLSVVLIKTNPNEETLRQCKKKPHLHEIFLGRFGVFAVIGFLQSTVVALGNLIFLGITVTDPFLYLLCYWVTGFVFEFIMYTLVASFGNVGKAIGVLLLVVQVTGANGSFPLQLLPDYASIVNPFLPATYAIGAMRASMNGIYMGDYWIYLGELLLFTVPMILLGLIFRRPFIKLNEKFVAKVEESKLI